MNIREKFNCLNKILKIKTYAPCKELKRKN